MCVRVRACVVGRGLRTPFLNMSSVELFKIYVLLKNVANVLQDRNKDVKVKTPAFQFFCHERLLPSTGYSCALLWRDAFALQLLESTAI